MLNASTTILRNF